MKQENPVLVLKGQLWNPEEVRAARLKELSERAGRPSDPDGKTSRAQAPDTVVPATVMARNGQLAGCVAMSADEKQMVDATMLWLQAVANALAQQAGWTPADLGDPDKRGGEAYWGFVNTAMTTNSPWLHQTFYAAGDIYDQTRSGEVNASDMMKDAITAINNPDAASSFEQLATDMGAAATKGDPAVNNVASDFWKHRQSDTKHSVAQVGSVTRSADGNLAAAFADMTINFVQDDWRGLFVKVHSASVRVQARGVAYEFLSATWAQCKDTILDKLQQWLNEGGANAPISSSG